METLADFLGVRDPRHGPDHQPSESPAIADLDELSPQEFCRTILRSREYRQSVLDRIKTGSLPPGIERWLWDTASEAAPPASPLEEWTVDKLEERVLILAEAARLLRQSTKPPPPREPDTPTREDSIH